MTVKSKRGRRRYILFDVSPETTKDTLIRGMNRLRPDCPPYVVQCEKGKAIIRCAPDETVTVAELMSKIDGKSHSLLTSGTLRTLREQCPVLKKPPLRK